MRAVGEETFEPRPGFGHGVGPRHAGDVEAALAGTLDQRALDVGGVCQKSRSA